MYSRLRLAQKYLHYYLKGSNGKGHGIHSPFVFDFIQSVLRDGHPYEPYTKVNGLRAQLLKNQKILSMEDFGAGSAFHSSSHRSIAEIARRASKSRKMGQLLFRVSHYYRPKIMIELGTSLGLSSAYLSLGNPDSKMITIEGSAEIAREAAGNFESLGLKNIKLINARFDDALAGIAARFQSQAANEKPDLGFIDGNHRKAATIKYFNVFMDILSDSSLLIIDDIHWSDEMEEAWNEMRGDPRVMLSIDLFQFGLIFRRKEFKVKQEFIIRF